jgi:hypothetical protein
MTDDEFSTEDLRRRQGEEEQAERERQVEADSEADAERHRRRAEKAGYLRRKLEERERSEHDADDAEPPHEG